MGAGVVVVGSVAQSILLTTIGVIAIAIFSLYMFVCNHQKVMTPEKAAAVSQQGMLNIQNVCEGIQYHYPNRILVAVHITRVGGEDFIGEFSLRIKEKFNVTAAWFQTLSEDISQCVKNDDICRIEMGCCCVMTQGLKSHPSYPFQLLLSCISHVGNRSCSDVTEDIKTNLTWSEVQCTLTRIPIFKYVASELKECQFDNTTGFNDRERVHTTEG